MNELAEAKKKENSNGSVSKDSIANTAALFGDETTIERVFKPFVKTGISEIDTMLGGGFTPGWAVLGAISNLGKSTFALQLAANIVKNGTPVMFFSFEMPADWIAAKLISQRTFVDGGKDPPKSRDGERACKRVAGALGCVWAQVGCCKKSGSIDLGGIAGPLHH